MAVDGDDGALLRILPVAGQEEVTGFNNLFFTHARKKISDDHLWLSVVYRSVKLISRRRKITTVNSIHAFMISLF